MSEHLPECHKSQDVCDCCCICSELRACEARVRSSELAEAKALLASRDEAWYAGLDAARDAALSPALWGGKAPPVLVTAFDALRGES